MKLKQQESQIYTGKMSEKGYIVNTPQLDVYQQMATDEFFCERMPYKYILRFYNWKENGITFGFSQRYNQVIDSISEEDKNLPITRRPTGGGIVFHKNDLTFSFLFYSPEMFNPYKTYESLHKSISESFSKNGIFLEILNSKTPDYKVNNPVMDCFSKPVEKDLMIGSKKILGGALRKFSDYMLYQASLQIENAREENIYKEVIKNAMINLYSINFEYYNVGKKDFEIIDKIAYNKYKSKEWINRI